MRFGAGPGAINDAGPRAINDAGPRAINDAGPRAINNAGPRAINNAGPRAINDAGPRAINDAGPRAIKHAEEHLLKGREEQQIDSFIQAFIHFLFVEVRTAPPPYYHSIVGDVPVNGTSEEGGCPVADGFVNLSNPLNYDELVVYDKYAALPAYLVLYSTLREDSGHEQYDTL